MSRPIRSNALAACPHAFARSGALARLALCVFLSVSLAFVPLGIEIQQANSENFLSLRVDAQRNEAQAFAPIAAGGAAAAAAALGITEAELAACLAAVFAAGAGIYMYTQNPIDTNGTLTGWPTDQAWPGFEPWDDLTPQEKQDWVGQDGTVDDYWQKQLDIYSLNYGLWEFDQNGQPTPTPEPEDPNDKEGWFTKNNVIKALATGGAVALGTVASTLTDTAANTLGDLLFGKENTATYQPLALQFSQRIATPNGIVQTAYYNLPNTGISNWVMHSVNSSNGKDRFILSDTTNFPISGVSSYSYDEITIVDGYVNGFRNIYFETGQTRNGTQVYTPSTSTWSTTWTNNSTQTLGLNGDNQINAAWKGKVIYPGGAVVENGAWNGQGNFITTIEHQIPQLPSDIPSYFTNNQAYQNNMNDWESYNLQENEKRAVHLPQISPNTELDWDSFVSVMPVTDITTVPNNAPLPTPTPNPNPNPNPDVDTDFQEDFGEEVTRLLTQPFDQLFPFCLIGDLRVFTEKVNTAFYDAGGSTKVDLPLEDFGIQGVDEMEIEGKPVADLGHIVKPWINALLIVALLVGSFRFFLNRGGE